MTKRPWMLGIMTLWNCDYKILRSSLAFCPHFSVSTYSAELPVRKCLGLVKGIILTFPALLDSYLMNQPWGFLSSIYLHLSKIVLPKSGSLLLHPCSLQTQWLAPSMKVFSVLCSFRKALSLHSLVLLDLCVSIALEQL